jgi:hypothetical protein
MSIMANGTDIQNRYGICISCYFGRRENAQPVWTFRLILLARQGANDRVLQRPPPGSPVPIRAVATTSSAVGFIERLCAAATRSHPT